MSLLERINSPEDLKRLSVKELPGLASEIRNEIIRVVAKNGGHLASNLGIVELTICLHYLLRFPEDTILWDVGHQVYTHKLLTGRKERFATLRQLDGLSGFPDFRESPYDPFIVGHSGTAISQALGIAIASELKRRKGKVVAVIGDGSLTTGMVFEAMNNVGQYKKDLVVILNDNEMAISKSASVISNYLNRVLSSSAYNKIKENLSSLIKSIPKIGEKVLTLAEKLDESVKNFLIPGMFFEQLGFRYFGPLDGHNIPLLLETLRNVFNLFEPTLVHIITKKGKGYEFAERFPEKFHSALPFDIQSGEFIQKKKEKSYTQLFGETLVELAHEDKRIVAITAAMKLGTGLSRFKEVFPDRFFDVGIAEQHAVTFASGLCKQGLKPFVAIYSTFLQRAYDQIIHDICLQELPVVFIVSNAGIVGEDGFTHQGIFDFAYLGQMPNMIVLAPRDGEELKAMLRFAVNEDRGPVAIRYPKSPLPFPLVQEMSRREIELGKAEVLREGKDAVILSIGSMVYPSIEATERLAKEGLDCTLVNMRFLKPLDTFLLKNLSSRTNRFISIEEHSIEGGLGTRIAEFFADEGIKAGLKRIALPCRFIEHGRREQILTRYGLTSEEIVKEIGRWISRRQSAG